MTQLGDNGNSEELLEGAKALGVKLGRLLAVLFVDEVEREAMLAVAQKMSPEQLVIFVETLEKKYLEAQTVGIDQQYGQEINKVAEEYKASTDALKQKALDQLSEIEKNI